jgi:hypothetical protein
MPPGTISVEPVPLCERDCQFAGCRKTFYVCPRCDRGQRYCSPECRAAARRLQHRTADAKYQKTDWGSRRHAKRQQRYREKHPASTEKIVTDPSFPLADSPSSCGCDDTRPIPQPQIQPLQIQPPPARTTPQPIPGGGLRCQFCGCRGYLQKRDSDEPDHPGKHP